MDRLLQFSSNVFFSDLEHKQLLVRDFFPSISDTYYFFISTFFFKQIKMQYITTADQSVLMWLKSYTKFPVGHRPVYTCWCKWKILNSVHDQRMSWGQTLQECPAAAPERRICWQWQYWDTGILLLPLWAAKENKQTGKKKNPPFD